jgi:hypothetical protein
VTLFLLHYFGILHLDPYPQHKLESDFDKDLWVALHGTYPSARESGVSEILLLRTDDQGSDQAVVGAYYPEVIFFPSRGRESWQGSEMLAPYLRAGRLSWAQSARILLEEEPSRADFQAHLRLVADRALQSSVLKNHLNNFCRETFGGGSVPTGTLDDARILLQAFRRWRRDRALRPRARLHALHETRRSTRQRGRDARPVRTHRDGNLRQDLEFRGR